MRYDLIIRNGSVVGRDGIAEMSIGISDGVIAAIEPELAGASNEEIDAAGLHVLSGVIDVHVHFNEPGRTDWEGLASGSAAVAAGGGTCFFDMPLNSTPPVLDGANFDRKRAAAERQAIVDFGLWGGLVPGDIDRLDELAQRGAVGFKAFLCASGIPEFARVDDRTLLDGMARAAGLCLPVAVHAEDEEITSRLAATARAEGRTGIRDYLDSRPIAAEVAAIRRAVSLAEETGCSLHVVHVSSGRGLAVVAEARRRGVDVTCETCPHYLILTEDDVERLGAAAKCAPPLRPRGETEELWRRLEDGGIDLVASDHSPSPPSLKTSGNFFEVWGGIAGCQSMLPILLTEGHVARGVPLHQITNLVARAPAERFRLGRKGRIDVECDADLVLVDLERPTPLIAEDLFYRHRISPYLTQKVHGLVRHTLVRGRTVFAGGKLTGVRTGRMVRPETTPRDRN